MSISRAVAGGFLPGLAMVVALGVSAPAIADEPTATISAALSGGEATPTAADVASALDDAGPLVEEGVPTTATPDGFVAGTNIADVSIPENASGQVIVEGDKGPVAIDVPGGSVARAVAAADGVLFEGALTDTTVVVKATDDGGAQLLAVLGSADAPTTLSFPVNAGPGSSLELNPDGSVSVLEKVTAPGGESVEVAQGEFSAPWAVDANGAGVPTTYEVRGMVLVQHIHPTETTVFPVTADPSFDVGWTGLFVHWSRSETRWLAGLTLAATASAVAALCAGPHIVLCAAAVGGIWYILNSVSNATVDYLYNRGYRFTTRLTPYVTSYWEKR